MNAVSARPWDARTRAMHASRAAGCAGCQVRPSGNTNHLPHEHSQRTVASGGRRAPGASSLPGQQAFHNTPQANRAAASTDHAHEPLLPPAPATSGWILIMLPRTWRLVRYARRSRCPSWTSPASTATAVLRTSRTTLAATAGMRRRVSGPASCRREAQPRFTDSMQRNA